ncbi:hypothetical protein ACFO3O_10920 [Dokdonia ponticola]|uniref:Uncharacterized protein n=1 Tax=Dokdonia ponticola TaxID=2041041 RepID=A0ABV9HX82_9FLAO
MQKIVFILILSLLFFSCDKDDNEIQTEDFSLFLERITPLFSASLDNEILNWGFGLGTYQTNIAYWNPNGDATNPNRYLRFVLNQENGDNQFLIRTPLYDTSSDIEFDTVFGLGIKTIGNSDDDFFIRIRNVNEEYSICDIDVDYQIEILKTEEIIDDDPSEMGLKVWIKIDDLSLNECNPDYTKNLTNGLILARFIGYKFE